MISNAGEFPQRLVDVLGTHADARALALIRAVIRSFVWDLICVRLQRLRVERNGELLFAGCANHPVSLDAASQKHGRADRPVVFAISGVVVGRAPHLSSGRSSSPSNPA